MSCPCPAPVTPTNPSHNARSTRLLICLPNINAHVRVCVCVCANSFACANEFVAPTRKYATKNLLATASLPTAEICMGQPKKVVERAINTAHSTRNTHSHTHTLTHTSSQINTLPHTNYLQLPHKVFTHNRLEVRHCPRSTFKYIYYICI